jgi:hypothetical protein
MQSSLYIERLPLSLQTDIREIERLSGMQFRIEPVTAAVIKEFPFAAKLPLLDIWLEHHIRLTLPESNVADHGIAHEIIHARRNLLESIPRLVPKPQTTPFQRDRVIMLENDLEHLEIVPEEISLFPDARSYWINLYANLLNEINPHGNIVDFDLFRHWMFLSHVLPGTDPYHQCKVTLEKARIRRFAEQFAMAIISNVGDKKRCIQFALDCFPGIRPHSQIERFEDCRRCVLELSD